MEYLRYHLYSSRKICYPILKMYVTTTQFCSADQYHNVCLIMNASVGTSTCVVKPFSDNVWLYATSTVFYGLGILGSCMLMKNVFVEFSSGNDNKRTIFSLFKAWIEFLVSRKFVYNGLHYSTLYLKISIYVHLIVGLDYLQIYISPTENFCFVKNYIKSPLCVVIGLSCTFSTVLKFYVLCIRKSMPEINESKLAKYAISSIIAVSLSFNYVKFSGNTKPTHNQVSMKQNYEKNLFFNLIPTTLHISR